MTCLKLFYITIDNIISHLNFSKCWTISRKTSCIQDQMEVAFDDKEHPLIEQVIKKKQLEKKDNIDEDDINM